MLVVFLGAFLVLGAFATMGLVGFSVINSVSAGAPKLADQRTVALAETSRIYAADGTLLAYLHGVENRTIIGGDRIPVVMKDAIVAIEDHRFYEHSGVDYEAMVRALVRNMEEERVAEGFSSITQQLVGNLYLDRSEITLDRKINEMFLAWQLEEKMSKDEILDQYLNTVYFGSNAYGIEAAARTYFDKAPVELTLAEAALLAGLVQAPSVYDPRLNPEAALTRRDQVLDDMLQYGFIDQTEFDGAIDEPLRLSKSSPFVAVQEPYVVAFVRQQLIDMFGQDAVFKGGLTVETTINPNYQRLAQEAIATTLDEEGDPSAALVAVEASTGYIRAMVGGTDYDVSKFNLAAQGIRQPGSAFKTFGLVAALEMGINPWNTFYPSQPLIIRLPGQDKPWNVKTFSNSYRGIINLVDATLASDNSVYAQLALDVTPERIVDVAHRMGVTNYVNPDPAIILGALKYGVSPLEMASAYATLANNGKHRPATAILRVRDSKGKVIWEAGAVKETQAISSGVAHVTNQILAQNVLYGTGKNAQLYDRESAGKTGTAEDFHDAWYCGYIPQVACAVWVGHPEAQIPMTDVHGISVTGGSFPAIIWQKFMSQVAKDYPAASFNDQPYEPVLWNDNFKSTHAAEPTTTTSSSTTTTTVSTTVTTGPTTSATAPTSTTLQPPTTTTTKPPTTTGTTSPPSTEPPST
jgi:penicillin-binding protein 1A